MVGNDTFAEEELNSGDLGSGTSIDALVARVGWVYSGQKYKNRTFMNNEYE